MLILSIFPGIDLLGQGFEECGFCVVRGPDLIYGGDIKRFHPPSKKFAGVIGGPPCQDFSRARTSPPTGYGLEMLEEYKRCVKEAQPDWWLLENVEMTPDLIINGYHHQRLDLYAHEFGLSQHRLRHIQFGHRHNWPLILDRRKTTEPTQPAITASDSTTPWSDFCALQGLPRNFDLPTFTVGAKRRAVGNAVPLPMARALAQAISYLVPSPDVTPCACGCGRPVTGKSTYARGACRTRAWRRRHASRP